MSDRLEAIVLAGGAGARFGGGKLLAPYADGRLLDAALRSAFLAPVDAVVVVTGHDPSAVANAAQAFADRIGVAGRLRLVHAPDHRDGMAASLRAGLGGVSKTASAAFVFLGDMPRVPSDIPWRLAAALGDHLAAAPVFEGRQGHPVLFKRALFASLIKIQGDRGARDLLQTLGSDLALVAVDDVGVLFDIDQKTDLLR